MKVIVLYVYPIFGGPHDVLARRFRDSYRRYPAGHPHEMWIVANGGEPTEGMRETFDGIAANWMTHDNTGFDIGAFLSASRALIADMMVYFGGNTYLTGPGWLARMVSVWDQNHFALYGCCGNNGRKAKYDADGNKIKRRHHPHIRTTGFWAAPTIIAAYPHPVTEDQRTRYLFEHGPHNLTAWLWERHHRVYCVTWTGKYEYPHWNGIPNGYRNGDESEVMAGDRCTFLLNKKLNQT